MRITQSMMSGSMMGHLQTNYQRLDKSQEQLMTQRRLNRPSDDPVGVASALKYRAEISSTTQFSENAEDADSWMKFSDTVMTEATQIVQRLSELAVQGGTDTVPEDARKNIAQEVDQLYKQLVSLGNSQFKGKYMFNGERVNEEPYPADPANAVPPYSLDQGQFNYQIGAGIYVGVNTNGDKIFGAAGDPNGLFKVVDDFKNALLGDSTTGIQAAIPALQKSLENIITAQAEVGGKQNRLEFTLNRLEDLNLNYTSLQSKLEDVDMPSVISDLKTAESIYQASLDTMARIIRPSLMDFLR
ncbi:flagellar hook-associated protein FlgL [Paenibacillus sp.]|jgi:flagellar hook-associated protein 3 FlgL|uniref:flagellar hook-associated protein FlgL n=1 Tax=Paenibacillus sp. TaxID=58172 RepID=UPI0028289E9B|nr:flagellar hook-associated protein FlgL [Paenibacillus sp.]MDR0268716.1 flagellar hook-associated protein FlgL [Paenibacillus sp.]